MKDKAESNSEQRAHPADWLPCARLPTVTPCPNNLHLPNWETKTENLSELSNTERGWINWDSNLFSGAPQSPGVLTMPPLWNSCQHGLDPCAQGRGLSKA